LLRILTEKEQADVAGRVMVIDLIGDAQLALAMPRW
jgi:hypothetical protein